MADVIVEKDRDGRNNSGLIAGIVIAVLLVLAALFVLPGLMNNGSTTTTPAPTPTTSTTPAQ